MAASLVLARGRAAMCFHRHGRYLVTTKETKTKERRNQPEKPRRRCSAAVVGGSAKLANHQAVRLEGRGREGHDVFRGTKLCWWHLHALQEEEPTLEKRIGN
eukprot:GHVT01080597.1.p1 GENE.GHVT01080597.1~~GHVT01080597.1.p1  ORF type:complete len:102 (-),score=14.97 GHVT01080597.1:96-401(-)